MYQSKEIRWFERTPDKNILNWFTHHGLGFDKSKSRVDFYLPLNGNNAIGVKLRDGNIEIKTRISQPEHYMLTDTVSGFTELWNKWSFGVEKKDQLADQIIHQQKYDWLEVFKERLGVKIVPGSNGEPEIKSISEKLSSGCQVEYTRLVVKEKIWYSFAIEWFGEPAFDPGDLFFQKMLGTTILHPENSMGYPEMLFKTHSS